MPEEKECTWWGGGSAMKIHWQRVWWNVKNILDFKTANPYYEQTSQKQRPAYRDLFHSFVNIQVEFCRACPYIAGHAWYYENLVLLTAVILVWILH